MGKLRIQDEQIEWFRSKALQSDVAALGVLDPVSGDPEPQHRLAEVLGTIVEVVALDRDPAKQDVPTVLFPAKEREVQ